MLPLAVDDGLADRVDDHVGRGPHHAAAHQVLEVEVDVAVVHRHLELADHKAVLFGRVVCEDFFFEIFSQLSSLCTSLST